MMEMPVRARRRLQDAAALWQERGAREDELREQTTSLRRRRMTCSSSLPSFSQTQDWTGGLGLSPSGRFQVVEEAGKKPRLFSREGIRWNAAWIMIAVLCSMLALILAGDLAGIGRSMRNISRLSSKIDMVTERNEQLDAQLAMSTTDLSVCTEAVKLNLIGSGGAKTVRLTAPVAANMKVTAIAGQENHGENEGD